MVSNSPKANNFQTLSISAPGQAFTFTDKYGQVCPEGWKPGGDTIVPEVGPSKEYFQLVYPGEGEEVMEVGTEDGEVMEEGEQLEAADEDSGVGVTSVGSGFTDKIEVSPSDEMIDQVISVYTKKIFPMAMKIHYFFSKM